MSCTKLFTKLCVTELYINQKLVPGEGNCLVRNSYGFAAISCFYSGIGYICEDKGKDETI